MNFLKFFFRILMALFTVVFILSFAYFVCKGWMEKREFEGVLRHSFTEALANGIFVLILAPIQAFPLYIYFKKHYLASELDPHDP